MPKTAKRKPSPTKHVTARDERAIAEERALRVAIRRESNIQRLARQLERAVTKTDRALGELGAELVDRMRFAPARDANAAAEGV